MHLAAQRPDVFREAQVDDSPGKNSTPTPSPNTTGIFYISTQLEMSYLGRVSEGREGQSGARFVRQRCYEAIEFYQLILVQETEGFQRIPELPVSGWLEQSLQQELSLLID